MPSLHASLRDLRGDLANLRQRLVALPARNLYSVESELCGATQVDKLLVEIRFTKIKIENSLGDLTEPVDFPFEINGFGLSHPALFLSQRSLTFSVIALTTRDASALTRY